MLFSVGITGGIGSGKSTIADVFAKLGVSIIDADIIAKDIVKPGSLILQTIINRYGQSIITSQGELYRIKLRSIIFKSQQERDWLNHLLHPIINYRIKQLKKLVISNYVVLVLPLLVENKLYSLVDRILVVDVDVATQLKRIQQRDNISFIQSQRIINAQTTRENRLKFATDIINNIGTMEDIKKCVNILHKKYLCLAEAKLYKHILKNTH